MGCSNFGMGELANDPLTSGDFMAEDVFVCEQQQKGLSNPLFSSKHHAINLEKSVLEFQDIVKRWISR